MVSTDEDVAREQLQLERWPVESDEKMPDRAKCRVKRTLTDLDTEIKARNEQLKKANQPKVEMEEVIAAQLYTGPVSVLGCFCACSELPLPRAHWRHNFCCADV